MRHLIITAPAFDDLEEIQDYIARHNPVAATRMLEKFYDRFETIVENPYLGEARNDLRSGLRAFSEGKYIIFYDFDDDRVSVVRVMHGARDYQSLFASEDQ